MKKKLKVLVLFDGTSPTTVDQDFTKELKTKDWKTEADVMAALAEVGHAAEHLAIYDDVDLVRQKLEYVDELMRSLVGKPPVNPPNNYRVADHDCLGVKLKTYYARKRKLYEDTYPDFYDADLRQLFSASAGIKASVYLQRRRRRLLNAICQWTNEKKFRVNQLLARLTRRCDQLGLHVLNDDPQQDFRVSAFITTLVMNYLFTGKFKRTK